MADVVSVLTGGSNNFATTSEHLNALATDILSEGVVGTVGNTSGVAPSTGGLAVNAQGSPNMTVAVTAGIAYVTTTPTSQGSQLLRANIAAQNATIAANSTGGTRYDWIYVSMSASGAANPAVDGTGVATITVSRSTSSSVDNGTPPTYGYNLAVVTVTNGASSITNGNITDSRASVAVSSNSTDSGWINLGATPDTITANGNRSYDLVFNSTDLTDTVSPGMRLKMTRATTAPIQCADLESSSTNYFNKTSPSGTTFTDDFVCSAWIKLESRVEGTIISRYNGTSGWVFKILSDGRVQLVGYNASSANYSYVISYQAIPLDKWVHVAAQLDMSTFTATTTTSYIMVDGVDVPAAVTRAGTNPTALVQAGNLEVGSYNGGTAPFDGKLAQVAYYSAKVTQATIKASIDRTLTGSETSLVSAYSLNNTINDLSATANNLTAQNSAVATSTDSPFAGGNVNEFTDGTVEMGIITKAAFSTNTTLTVQVPEGYAIPTTGGLSAVSYSTHRSPYGFPSGRDKWSIGQFFTTSAGNVTNTSVAQYTGHILLVPVGSWTLRPKVTSLCVSNAAGGTSIFSLSASTSVIDDPNMSVSVTTAVGSQIFTNTSVPQKTVLLTSATNYYIVNIGSGAGITMNMGSSTSDGENIIAECAYL